ncbi:MAG: hypothetical protein ABJA02_14185 [Acidobacteriota bacterium]
MMKSVLFTYAIIFLFGCILILASSEVAVGQTYVRRVTRHGRVTYVRVRKPSFYRRHRHASNIAIGTGAGAIVGGLIGGPKGVLIGAGAGAGGSALYTYKWNPKKRRYYKIRKY